MRFRIFVSVLLLGLIITAAWGYSQYQTKRQWEIRAENQYQRAFQELSANVSSMEVDMSKSLVAASFPQTIRLLTNIWRESNACQENLGQLPLPSMDLSSTNMLLANVSAYCFNTAQNKLIKGEKITAAEWDGLRVLRDRTRVMTQHLCDLQQNFYNSRARWLDIDQMGAVGAVGMTKNIENNKVTKSFIMLEDGLKRTPNIVPQGNNLNFTPKPTGLTGRNVSIKEAELIARHFVAPEFPGATARCERVIHGGFPSYLIKINDPKNRVKDLYLNISVKGGHVAWMLGNRSVAAAKLSLVRAGHKAVSFLNRNGYYNMKVVAKESFNNVATVTCVPERQKVLYYPELTKVQVAQDNGEVIGCDFIPNLTFYNPKENTNPKLAYTLGQIKKLVNPHMNVTHIALAQVLDQMFNKVFCHEIAGNQGNDHYLIYYNANTGKEEKIRKIDQNGNEIL